MTEVGRKALGGTVVREKLGLIGFGAFGRLTARHLSAWFDILAHDPGGLTAKGSQP